ncbi:AAA family ATPase [Streptomyces inhibens]|uniref:AAA family ATPase n=1 Tax=Streptomyces inhibens TaxID=2293571 RepID=UPI001EE73DE1|nr:AAA family ATPase [Streptomyces inhibens]UKY54663.1 AAA family ATPase [Streptomyces inhibens]
MSAESPLIKSMRTAVAAAPDDVPLRLHLAELLLAAGHGDAAVGEVAVALQHAPGDVQARELMVRALAGTPVSTPGEAALPPTSQAPVPGQSPAPATVPPQAPVPGQPPAPATVPPQAPVPSQPPAPASRPGFDWKAAEDQVGDAVPPRFVEAPLTVDGGGDPGDAAAWDVERPGAVRLADVGGMQEVKERLEAAFLAPLRNPELRRLYGKSLRGGLLLYGPPGCGKTFIARAVAGELGANFLSVSVNDVLDMWIGTSERNMHELFQTARRQAPCVVFLDELDALGGKRSRTQSNGMRNTVNQLLTELDGIEAREANQGVFVLAATNVPWDVDIALRRPGRLDRTLLVLPPDGPAREAILRYHLRERPIENVDLGKLVKATDGLSGADLAHVCEAAAEHALLDSARTGTVRLIGMKDLLAAAGQIAPSTEPWFASARNVAMYANDGGMYDDLVAYLKKKRKL